MQTYCDRCNETEDHPINIVDDAEVAELAGELGYRNVCSGCYDDLVVEARETREQRAEDRRTKQRVAASVPIRIGPTEGDTFEETVTEDISEGGAQIRAFASLEPGAVVRIATGDGSVDAVALVEIVWHDGEAMRAGLKLVEPSESWNQLVRQHSPE